MDRMAEMELFVQVAESGNLTRAAEELGLSTSAADKAGLHVSAIAKAKDAYEHVDPAIVGNHTRVLVSDLVVDNFNAGTISVLVFLARSPNELM